MKKGRPAHTVSALVDPALATPDRRRADPRDRHARRARSAHRALAGARGRCERVLVEGHAVRVKVSPGRIKAEYDDAAKVARRTGRPLREVTLPGRGGLAARPPGQPHPDDGVPGAGRRRRLA